MPDNLQWRPPNHLQAAPQHTPVQLHGGSLWSIALHHSTRATKSQLILFQVLIPGRRCLHINEHIERGDLLQRNVAVIYPLSFDPLKQLLRRILRK